MIFRRTVQRHLGEGVALIVTRDFRVRFTALGNGRHHVEGQQVAARVDAPESLATLARLEEARVEIGGFPLMLDAQGCIESTDRPRPANPIAAEVLEEVSRMYGDDPDALRDLLDAMRASSAQFMSYPPADLFAPAQPESEQRQAITLPWGDTGEVLVRFAAVRSPETGLMRRASREVTTSLLGETQHSAERWELFNA